MSVDTTPYDASEWWLVIFTNTELPPGAARYRFPKGQATGGAIVHSKVLPFERVREMTRIAWGTEPEHLITYQLANREANLAMVDRLLTPAEAERLWNTYATDVRDVKR